MAELTTERLQEIEQRLHARRAQLLEEIHRALLEEERDGYAELAGRVRDAGDDSLADLLSDLNIAIIDRQVQEVAQIEAALGRIAADTYGTCIDCGETIDPARIDAYPTAERCITCQSRREETYAGPQTPSM